MYTFLFVLPDEGRRTRSPPGVGGRSEKERTKRRDLPDGQPRVFGVPYPRCSGRGFTRRSCSLTFVSVQQDPSTGRPDNPTTPTPLVSTVSGRLGRGWTSELPDPITRLRARPRGGHDPHPSPDLVTEVSSRAGPPHPLCSHCPVLTPIFVPISSRVLPSSLHLSLSSPFTPTPVFFPSLFTVSISGLLFLVGPPSQVHSSVVPFSLGA